MSEKDSVSGSALSAVVRALGTLALAAATAVVIKWFLSRDPKNDNAEGNRGDSEKKLSSKDLKEQSCIGCFILDDLSTRKANAHQVSDGGDSKVNLEDIQELTNPTNINFKRIVSGNGTANLIAQRFCDTESILLPSTQIYEDTSPEGILYLQCKGGCNDPEHSAGDVQSGTNSVENQVSDGYVTHRRTDLATENSQRLQETAASSGSGECIHAFNIKYSISDPTLKSKTVNAGLSDDSVIHGPEKNEGHSVTELTICLETENNILDLTDKSILNNGDELVLRQVVSNTGIDCNIDSCVSNLHSVSMESGNKWFTSNTTTENDSCHCATGQPDNLSLLHEPLVSSNNYGKDLAVVTTLASKDDPTVNMVLDSNEGQKLFANKGKATNSLICLPVGYNLNLKQSLSGNVQTNDSRKGMTTKKMYKSTENNIALSETSLPIGYNMNIQQSLLSGNVQPNNSQSSFPEIIDTKENYNATENDIGLSATCLPIGYNVNIQESLLSGNVQTNKSQLTLPKRCTVEIHNSAENIMASAETCLPIGYNINMPQSLLSGNVHADDSQSSFTKLFTKDNITENDIVLAETCLPIGHNMNFQQSLLSGYVQTNESQSSFLKIITKEIHNNTENDKALAETCLPIGYNINMQQSLLSGNGQTNDSQSRFYKTIASKDCMALSETSPIGHNMNMQQFLLLGNGQTSESQSGFPQRITKENYNNTENDTDLSETGLPTEYNINLQQSFLSGNVQTYDSQFSSFIDSDLDDISSSYPKDIKLEDSSWLQQSRQSPEFSDAKQTDIMNQFDHQHPNTETLSCPLLRESTLKKTRNLSKNVSTIKTYDKTQPNLDISRETTGLQAMNFVMDSEVSIVVSEVKSSIRLINNEQSDTNLQSQDTYIAEVQMCESYKTIHDLPCEHYEENTEKQEDHCKSNDYDFLKHCFNQNPISKCPNPYSHKDNQAPSYVTEIQNCHSSCLGESCNVVSHTCLVRNCERLENNDGECCSKASKKQEDFCRKHFHSPKHFYNNQNSGESQLIHPCLGKDNPMPVYDTEFQNWQQCADDAPSLHTKEDSTSRSRQCSAIDHDFLEANRNGSLIFIEQRKSHPNESSSATENLGDTESEVSKPLYAISDGAPSLKYKGDQYSENHESELSKALYGISDGAVSLKDQGDPSSEDHESELSEHLYTILDRSTCLKDQGDPSRKDESQLSKALYAFAEGSQSLKDQGVQSNEYHEAGLSKPLDTISDEASSLKDHVNLSNEDQKSELSKPLYVISDGTPSLRDKGDQPSKDHQSESSKPLYAISDGASSLKDQGDPPREDHESELSKHLYVISDGTPSLRDKGDSLIPLIETNNLCQMKDQTVKSSMCTEESGEGRRWVDDAKSLEKDEQGNETECSYNLSLTEDQDKSQAVDNISGEVNREKKVLTIVESADLLPGVTKQIKLQDPDVCLENVGQGNEWREDIFTCYKRSLDHDGQCDVISVSPNLALKEDHDRILMVDNISIEVGKNMSGIPLPKYSPIEIKSQDVDEEGSTLTESRECIKDLIGSCKKSLKDEQDDVTHCSLKLDLKDKDGSLTIDVISSEVEKNMSDLILPKNIPKPRKPRGIDEACDVDEEGMECMKEFIGSSEQGDVTHFSSNLGLKYQDGSLIVDNISSQLEKSMSDIILPKYIPKQRKSQDIDEDSSEEGREHVEDFFSSSKKFPKDEHGDLTDSNLSLTEDLVSESRRVDNISGDISREEIMSTIAESPDLRLPDSASKCKKMMTRSCDNILSGHPRQEPTLKNKAQSMLCLLTEYYSSKLPPTENGPVEEVARGSFIRIPKGLQCVGEAMRFQLNLGNCLELLKLARKNSVPELVKTIYTLISDNYLNVLKNGAVYGQLTCMERERILQLRVRGKLSLCVVETKSIFGLQKNIGCAEEFAKLRLYSLESETNRWKPVTVIPEEACLKGCSICSMHNYLFIAGGLQKSSTGSTCSNKLFCYNPLTDIWTQLSQMNEGRSQLKLVPLDGFLYAIGGECLHTVERYDPRTNKWTFVAPLPKGSFAVAHEAVACGGAIYVSGGHLFYRLLKYIPLQDVWEECPFNASKGRSCDMVAVGNTLYRFDMHKDSSVNILKYNTLAKVWSEYTTTFPGSKIPFRCALLEGDIYCLNRETTAKFFMDNEKVVFEANVFGNVPNNGEGTPHPVILCLPGSMSQTSV